jgi:hypothetical protein
MLDLAPDVSWFDLATLYFTPHLKMIQFGASRRSSLVTVAKRACGVAEKLSQSSHFSQRKCLIRRHRLI